MNQEDRIIISEYLIDFIENIETPTLITENEKTVVKEALEKQIPKKPIQCYCAKCETDLDVWNYCPVCGQAIDWSDDNVESVSK